ncbi:MAG: DUF4041 domain-containing protein [Elusimicrobia bacterium]|nr:DUF4041 domain-containing protein [Elusimicrobiota bacterium]
MRLLLIAASVFVFLSGAPLQSSAQQAIKNTPSSGRILVFDAKSLTNQPPLRKPSAFSSEGDPLAPEQTFGKKAKIAGILSNEEGTYLVADMVGTNERIYFFYGGTIDGNRIPLPPGTHLESAPVSAKPIIADGKKAAVPPTQLPPIAQPKDSSAGANLTGWALAVFFSLCAGVLGTWYREARSQLEQYKPLINIDMELVTRQKAVSIAQSREQEILKSLAESQAQLAKLASDIAILTDDHDLLSAGFYKPRYAFADAKQYAERLEEIRDRQKRMIKEKTAIICSTEWSVGNSRAEGKKMTDRTIKLGLAAFNVQCDNEIFSVRFDNIDRSELKMAKIRENVDRLLEPNRCKIVEPFFKLKLEELYLAYEYEEQREKEKEEQRMLREQIREEEKARREAERAEVDARREEERFAKALVKAKEELEEKSGAEREAHATKVAELEALLQAANEKKARAKSLAEQTRMGHVYIISNIGSFGENVFKIGMTRRWDPMDRIWELSDASVPFDFDVHALVKSDDAPALERKLHMAFINHRINKVNERKEFFKVSLEEIAEECRRHHGSELELTLIAEAKEYRQTVALASS